MKEISQILPHDYPKLFQVKQILSRTWSWKSSVLAKTWIMLSPKLELCYHQNLNYVITNTWIMLSPTLEVCYHQHLNYVITKTWIMLSPKLELCYHQNLNYVITKTWIMLSPKKGKYLKMGNFSGEFPVIRSTGPPIFLFSQFKTNLVKNKLQNF